MTEPGTFWEEHYDAKATHQGACYPTLWGGDYGSTYWDVRHYREPRALWRHAADGRPIRLHPRHGAPKSGGRLEGFVTTDGTPWLEAPGSLYLVAREANTKPERLKYFSDATPESIAESGARCCLSLCMRSGFMLRPLVGHPLPWELEGLFSCGSPRGAFGLELAEALGARQLSCIGRGLRNWYELRGWEVHSAEAWDPVKAPSTWTGPGEAVYTMVKR